MDFAAPLESMAEGWMAKGGTNLKSANAAWLWSIAALDVVLLLTVQLHGSPESADAPALAAHLGIRGAGAAAAPVVVLLLTSILPGSAKSVLVFWRFRDVLPSHRAFSVYAQNDPRIGLTALRKNVGKFPEAPRDQSATWYRLYHKVETEVSVLGAHRHYLLFRDLAALSAILVIIVPIIFYFFARQLALPGLILFGVQYLLSAVAARHNGVRMVTTVLALHSAKKYE